MESAPIRVTPPPPTRYSASNQPASTPQDSSVPIGPDGLPVDSVVVPDIGALTRELSESELRRFSNETLCRLRNEYYVRHGYTFTRKTNRHLTDFFEAESWYAVRPVQSFDAENPPPWGNFPPNEQKTINTIKVIERRRGSWHTTHQGTEPPEPYPNGE